MGVSTEIVKQGCECVSYKVRKNKHVFLYTCVCEREHISISLVACSALVTLGCLMGGPTAQIKPTPAASVVARSC